MQIGKKYNSSLFYLIWLEILGMLFGSFLVNSNNILNNIKFSLADLLVTIFVNLFIIIYIFVLNKRVFRYVEIKEMTLFFTRFIGKDEKEVEIKNIKRLQFYSPQNIRFILFDESYVDLLAPLKNYKQFKIELLSNRNFRGRIDP